jgi:hypothetical protein
MKSFFPLAFLSGESKNYRHGCIASRIVELSTQKFTSLDDLLNVMDGEKEGSAGDEKYEERFTHYLGLLSSENPGDRWRAIEVLARTGDERAIDPLIAALKDEDWRVRQKAAWALGYLGDPRALTPLRRVLGDRREGVDDMIYEALDRIKMRMAEALREQG